MYRFVRSLKIVGLCLSLCLLALTFVFNGPAGAEGPSVTVAPVNIRVVPNVIGTKVNKITVYGSGFTPSSQVTVGFPGVPVHKKLPMVKGMWVTVVPVNKYGAFSVDINLKRNLWRLSRIIGKKNVPSVYTVMAKNKQREVATTALVVEKPKKK